MIVGGIYSFNGGEEVIEQKYYTELIEIKKIIGSVDALKYKTKISKEKTMTGKKLFKPSALNKAFSKEFESNDWNKFKVRCEYSTDFYTPDYKPSVPLRNAYREMDFAKNRVGVEIQFGKYAFMVYNVCAKMTIFHNLDVIDVGIEIVPMKELAREMSTGVSYFEQFSWDLEKRGVSDIDIPVLVLGVSV